MKSHSEMKFTALRPHPYSGSVLCSPGPPASHREVPVNEDTTCVRCQFFSLFHYSLIPPEYLECCNQIWLPSTPLRLWDLHSLLHSLVFEVIHKMPASSKWLHLSYSYSIQHQFNPSYQLGVLLITYSHMCHRLHRVVHLAAP